MPTRISLLCHGRTQAQRHGRFALDDEPLEAGEAQRLAARVAEIKAPRRILCAPEWRARQTAAAWSGDVELLDVLRDCDYGAWRGRSLAALQEEAAPALAEWLSDPASAPHGGESQAHLCARIGAWLDGFGDDGHILVVSHPAVIRAAVLHALQAGAQAFNCIDVAPLALVDLRFHGRWRLRV